ncbi:MAG: hypothetical protein MUO82_00800 [Candidatus Thermoplasmatota archaeon]|nr:hypothetical protein [Candidatus Thermoplasmatota archaeon]
MAVKIKYPDGHITNYQKVDYKKGYGYIFRDGKVLKYPIPKKTRENGDRKVTSHPSPI